MLKFKKDVKMRKLMRNITLILMSAFISFVACGQAKQKVAVYVTGTEGEGINEFIGAYLVDAIVNGSNYLAIERTADFINELNKEQEYQRTGAVNDDQISQLGQQFGVQLVCVAKVGKVGHRQFVSARMIDVETATVRNSTKPVLFTMDDIDKSCAAVATSLIGGEPVNVKRLAGTGNNSSVSFAPSNNSSPRTILPRPTPSEGEIALYLAGYEYLDKEKHGNHVFAVFFDGIQIGSGTLRDGFAFTIKDIVPGVHKVRITGVKVVIVEANFKIDTSENKTFEFGVNKNKGAIGHAVYSFIKKNFW